MFKKYFIMMFIHIILALYTSALHAKDEIETGNKALANKMTTTGFLQEITEVRIHTEPDRTGVEVYEFRCKGCHEKNTQGAPMPDDNFEWSMRLKQKGINRLLKHSMDGYNNLLMPPKGGCRNCNQSEVYAAFFYMLKRSGINIEKLNKASNR